MSDTENIAIQDLQTGLQRVRHKVSTALAFMESSVGNLAGDARDIPKATRLYEVGSNRLREAIAELDSLMNENSKHENN